jgi:hypothetical protein
MHWLLDVEFNDDLSRYRTGHGSKHGRRLGLVRADKSEGGVKNTAKMEPSLPAPNTSDEMSIRDARSPLKRNRRRALSA